MHRARVLACFAITTACYTRPSLGDDTDGEDTTGTMSVGESTLTTSDTTPTTTGAMTSVTGDTSPPTTTASSDTEATTEPDSTGNTELGPQIVMSIPADGDLAAGLDPYFFIYFDRVVGVNDAVGKITVAQDGGTPAVVSPMQCPPDADPTCIAGLFPESFSDPATGRLPANTSHTVTVAADFPDPDGLVNTMDQTVAFTTFDFTADFFDDTANISDEIGGIAYDEGSQSLFIVGLPPSGGDAIVRRIPIPGGVPGAATTVASPSSMGGGPYAYGIDAIGGELYVAMSYSGDVRRYSNLGAATLDATEVVVGPNTGLAAPDDTLLQVQSVTVAGGNTLFARGYFLATDPGYSIFARNGGGTFSIWEDGSNLWDNADWYGNNITAGTVDGSEVLFVANSLGIFKFRVADGTLLGSIMPDYSLYSADLHIDANDHLFLGSDSGVFVYDAASDDLPLVTAREGLEASRIALREDAGTVFVYYLRFRGEAIIGELPIAL
ncbi:MAG TPA: hypothetical protein VG755_39355, partial [Nannocystaceae bacterium]|nr:hypothetical protein [Nannocystaceae bacterium]